MPQRTISSTGRITANSTSAWPFSFCSRRLITWPRCLLSDNDKRELRGRGRGRILTLRRGSDPPSETPYELHRGGDTAENIRDLARQKGQGCNHGDGDDAQDDGVLGHGLAVLVRERTKQAVQVIDQKDSPPPECAPASLGE